MRCYLKCRKFHQLYFLTESTTTTRVLRLGHFLINTIIQSLYFVRLYRAEAVLVHSYRKDKCTNQIRNTSRWTALRIWTGQSQNNSGNFPYLLFLFIVFCLVWSFHTNTFRDTAWFDPDSYSPHVQVSLGKIVSHNLPLRGP